jgi:adenylate kinase
VKEGTELGKQAKVIMDKGELVTDSIVLGMVKERLSQPDCKKGYILDGFPRNTAQAEALDKMLDAMGMAMTAAVSVDVPAADLIKRLTGRRTCKSCGQMFNVYFSAPKTEGKCDKCGGELFQRDDDNEETIKNRLKVYEAQTAPLIDYYTKKGINHSVNGTGDMDAIFAEVCKIVEG